MFKLQSLYAPHVQLTYLCIDRIYIRGYVPILQSCGGFRTWAERLRPDEAVTQTWIRSLTRRFHENVKKYASEHSVPVLKLDKGKRKHLVADEYRETTDKDEGVYLIIKSFEKAKTVTSAEPAKDSTSKHRNLQMRKGFVTHYSFYIIDRQWGPISVSISSHPPFGVKVFLNAHHWVARRAAAKHINVEVKGNAFLGTDDAEQLQQLCDRLGEQDIRRVADRWTYRVLPILTSRQRHDSRFRYEWSMVQMEVSHNLVFTPKYPLAELFQRHIDLNRRLYSPSNIATVFGKKRPGRINTTSVSVYESYDSWTVQRIKQDRTVIKQYDKYHRILRTECVSNDSLRFGVGKLLSNFNALRSAITAALTRFEALQQGVANSTLDRGELAALAQTSELGRARVPGIRLDNERIMTVLRLLGSLATGPRGFTAGQLRERYSTETACDYSAGQVTYDLRKLRAKKILEPVGKSKRYVLTSKGARLTVLMYKLHDLLLEPTLGQAVDISPQISETVLKRRGPPPEPVPITQLETLLLKHAGNICATAREMNRQTVVVRRWIRRESIDIKKFRHPVPNIRFDEAQADVGDALGKLTAALDLRFAA